MEKAGARKMQNHLESPYYYDGSGSWNLDILSTQKTTVIKPEETKVPFITNIKNKPTYYDGSGQLIMKG